MDGSGQFRTIQEAVNSIPVKNTRRYAVYVKAGVYNEHVIVNAPNVFMYGDGVRRTRVVGDKHFPIPPSQTATFNVLAPGFLCNNMGFSNTAGPQGHQAVALLVASDMSAFFNCRMDGYQDTLYSKAGRQFYRNCIVSGTVDFIFGDAATILQNCLIIVHHPMLSQMNTITAHSRLQQNGPTGIVIQNCRIVPEIALQADSRGSWINGAHRETLPLNTSNASRLLLLLGSRVAILKDDDNLNVSYRSNPSKYLSRLYLGSS